ncbi:MAG: insulinase family protein [Clostridia bacterium]|nr:insulinase family protein [Clostridia bacterium]
MTEKITLPNGLRIVHERLPGVRSCTLGLWVESGSRHEPPELCGISHYIEHMLFKGTDTRTAAQLAADFDAIGGQVNAFTTKEHTCYYCRTLDSHLQEAAGLLCDMFFHSKFAPRDVELEQSVIFEEIDMYEDTPEDLVSEQLVAAVYDGCSLARPILGYKDTLAAINGDTLRDYRATRYTPENTVVALCGSYSDEDLALLVAQFEGMGQQTPPSRGAVCYKPAFVVRKKEIEQNHLIAAFPSLETGSPERFVMQIMNNTLGGGMSSRLFQRVREQQGLCYSIYSYTNAYFGAGALGIYVALSARTELSALTMIREELDRLCESGITEEELARSREQLKANVLMGLEGTSSRMNTLARNELIYGRQHTAEDIIAGFDAVTRDDILKLAQRTFAFDAASLSAVGQVKTEADYRKAFGI